MTLNANIPNGPLSEKWSSHKFNLKLVKFDLLGLSNLGIIQSIISLIRENHKDTDKLDLSLSDTEVMSSIPLNDVNVYELFPSNLLGIFQFETNAVQKILKHVLPTNLQELCALNSLNRPATKDLIEQRYLLYEDLDRIVDLAGEHYDYLTT